MFKAENKGRIRKIILVLVTLSIIAAAGYYIYTYQQKKNISYLSVAVTKGNISETVQATATVKPVREVDLTFKNSGTLARLYVKVGDRVEAGQILAVQDDSEAKTQLAQAENGLRQAELKVSQCRLEYEKAQRTLKRQEELFNAGAISATDYEQAQDDCKKAEGDLLTAESEVENSKTQLATAQKDLADTQLVAPFAGIVTQVNGETGERVGGSNSLIHLISQELRLRALVNEVDIGKVKVGQEVEFTLASYADKTFTGKVENIYPEASTVNNVQFYEVDIASDKEAASLLLPGLSATVNIIINRRNDVLVVPVLAFNYAENYGATARRDTAFTAATSAASTRSGSKSTATTENNAENQGTRRTLFVLENNQPVARTVLVGLNNGQSCEIIEGLNPGERVVIGTNQYTQATSTTGSSNQQSRSQGQPRMFPLH